LPGLRFVALRGGCFATNLQRILTFGTLDHRRVCGTSGGAVKCVDIGRNAGVFYLSANSVYSAVPIQPRSSQSGAESRGQASKRLQSPFSGSIIRGVDS
jgi:hypothetical protein